MKLFATAFVFALSSIQVSGSAIDLHRRALSSICGEGSVVLNQTSVSHDGKTFLVSTSTFSPTKRDDTTVSKRSAINIDKRQDICTDGDCTVECDTTTPVAAADNCDSLISYIASYAPGELIVAAGGSEIWADDTCGIGIANNDTEDYTVCYETVAYDAALAVTDCFGVSSSASCSGSGTRGDAYVIAVVSV